MKIINRIGLVVGITMIIAGMIFCFVPVDTYSTTSVENASFGGDFYTYEYKATQAAASNAAVVANNLREISERMDQYVGVALIFAGLLVVLEYSKKCIAEKNCELTNYEIKPTQVIQDDNEKMENEYKEDM